MTALEALNKAISMLIEHHDSSKQVRSGCICPICADNLDALQQVRDGEQDFVTKRIRRIALEFCSDYPKVETTDTLDLLWAIESTLRGYLGAIEEWSKVCKALMKKAGITDMQMVVMWDQLVKDVRDEKPNPG